MTKFPSVADMKVVLLAASLAGLASAAAGEARQRPVEAAAAGILASLQGFAGRRDAVGLAKRAVEAGAPSLRVLRKAVVFQLVKPRRAAAEVMLS